MKRIILITIYDLNNYGNRLQNYALWQTLSNLSKEVVTVPDVKQRYHESLFLKVRHFVATIVHLLGGLSNKRYNSFLRFTIRYIPSFMFKTPEHVCWDEAVVGSDQVWNPHFKHLSDYDTLEFAKSKDAKGIAYAASFGVDDLPEEYVPQLQQIARNFSYISVREESGKRLLEKHTERKDVEVLVDPTLLLSSEMWEKVSAKPKKFKHKRFVLLYFLGNLSEEKRREIEELAAEKQCEIVELMDKESVYYSYGPSEFLWCIAHAEFIFTDSYHGSIFSFLYDKPFLVYVRDDNTKDMSTRLDTLLSKFGLEDRKYTGTLSNDILAHDYSDAYKVLEQERNKSHEFLKKALLDKQDED